MDMFTLYGHVKKPEKNYRFYMILAWLYRFLSVCVPQLRKRTRVAESEILCTEKRCLYKIKTQHKYVK